METCMIRGESVETTTWRGAMPIPLQIQISMPRPTERPFDAARSLAAARGVNEEITILAEASLSASFRNNEDPRGVGDDGILDDARARRKVDPFKLNEMPRERTLTNTT